MSACLYACRHAPAHCVTPQPCNGGVLRSSSACSRTALDPDCITALLALQEDIIHEAQTMKSYHHPNVLPLYTSFVHGQDLWMVTPFMSGGSVLHIMKYRFPKVRTMSGFRVLHSTAAGRVVKLSSS